jgi:hypothetical protein
LTINGTDGVLSDTGTITIAINNINDNAPIVDDASVALGENASTGTIVVVIS